MKKNIVLTVVVLTAIGLVLSCAKETPAPEEKPVDPQEEVKTNPSVIKAGIPEEITKVSLTDEGVGNGMSLAWQADDKLRVIATAGGDGNEQFTIKDGYSATSAEFEGTPVAGTAFTVFYPGTYADVDAINARSYTSQVQDGNGRTAHLEWNAIETGVGDYSTVTFSNKQNGALRFILQLPDSFTKVKKVALKASDNIFSTTNAGNVLTDELVLTLKDGSNDYITLGGDKVLTAYMMVSWNDNTIPGNTDLQIEVWGDPELPWVKTKTVASKGYTIAGGKVTNIKLNDENWEEPLFWGGSGTDSDPYQVKTLKNLKNMYTGEANKDIYYIMIDDIALSSEEADEYVEINNFYGHLDGDGHTITGLETPLFGDLKGWVSNLDVTADINFNGTDPRIKGVDYGIGILAHYIYNTDDANTISNVTTRGSLTIDGLTKSHAYQVGGIAGSSNGVPLSDCKNYATITIESVNVGANAFRVGGLTGVLQTSLRAGSSDCKNFGTVTVKTVTSSKDVAIAGVFGLIASQPMTISNCDNAGAVAVNYIDIGSITWNAVGGIVGDSGQALKIDGCDNTAAITNANANDTGTIGNVKYSTGGVAGRLTKNATLSNCSSSGDITAVVFAGGILGTNTDNGLVMTSCKSSGTLSITGGDNYSAYCGGLAGQLSGTIEKSFSTMNITTSQIGKLQKALGGLIGGVRENSGTTTYIKESYYNGTISIRSQGGGLVGHSQRNITIQNCYSAGTLTNYAGFAAAIIGYVNNGAKATLTNCYTTMDVSNTFQGGNNALGGMIGGSDTTTNKWDISGLLAWNSSISFKTNTNTDGVIIGRFHSGASDAATKASNCWYMYDLSYTKASTARTPGNDADVDSSPGSARYDGHRAAEGVTCSQKASEIGWDDTTIWNLTGGYPALKRVVE